MSKSKKGGKKKNSEGKKRRKTVSKRQPLKDIQNMVSSPEGEQQTKVIKSPSGFDFTFKTGNRQLSKRRRKKQVTEADVEEQNRKLSNLTQYFTELDNTTLLYD